jgi:transporter family-2 protein
MLIYLAIALFAGFLLANQGPINADLRKTIGSPFWASVLSQIIGTIFLALISLTLVGSLFPSLHFILSNPLWIWIGGFIGPIYVTSTVFLFPRLGAVQTVILPIFGQILMGVVIDSFGWFSSNQIPLTTMRGIGMVVTIIGIISAVVLPNLGKNKTEEKAKAPVALQIWAVISGTFLSIQQAINGHLGSLLGAPAKASFLSFFLGLIAISLVTILIERKLPKMALIKKAKKWNMLGGVWGALFVLGAVLAVPQIGTGLNIMMGLVGQILGSMFVQQFGWWKSSKYRVQLWQILGVLIMLLGIVFIKFL